MVEITEYQHPDSIWTWKSNRKARRATVWLPYVSHVEKRKGHKWYFKFNGGEVETELSKVECLMFYGATGVIPVALIDELAMRRIPLLVHRRNIGRPAVFLPAPSVDSEDILTKQIVARNNETRRAYLARTLIRERFKAVQDTMPISGSVYRRLARARDLKEIRAWEAVQSKRYWRVLFANVGYPDISRRGKGPVPSALNAGSMFLSGILLRWILIHRLSPSHGFLHQGTDYAALVYDLIEPGRYIIERALAEACLRVQADDGKRLTQTTLSIMKSILEEAVYVPATRQVVRRKNLIHGYVLALRAYLAADMRRFVVPAPGPRTGGRPLKVSFRLPGDTNLIEKSAPI